jgi:hypothetical protein
MSQKDFPEAIYSTKWIVSRRVRAILQICDCQPPKIDEITRYKARKGQSENLLMESKGINSGNGEKNRYELKRYNSEIGVFKCTTTAEQRDCSLFLD